MGATATLMRLAETGMAALGIEIAEGRRLFCIDRASFSVWPGSPNSNFPA
jgi:hypothetical protein